MNPTLAPYVLFGSTKPFLPPPWTTTDDRLRGGSSQSHLSALPHNSARFHGHLDTSTLGGAGFASQFSPLEAAGTFEKDGGDARGWDLSAYDGIEVEVGRGDGKVYTLILKDGEEAAGGKREDGREKAGVSWEVDFVVGEEGGVGDGDEEKEGGGGGDEGTKIWVPWEEFKATYRGKEKDDAGELKRGEIKRVGLMMRSYFGKQEGDFSLVLKSIRARKTVKGDEQRTAKSAVGRLQGSMPDKAIREAAKGRGTGWFDWFSGRCTVA